MTTKMQNSPQTTSTNGSCGCTIPFDQINETGAYVCNWSGHLLRVPDDGIAPGRSPLLTLVGPDQLFVTKISSDPFVTLTKARMMACNYDINVNF